MRALITLVRMAEPVSYSEAVRFAAHHRPERLLILSVVAALPGLIAYGALAAWFEQAKRAMGPIAPVDFSVTELLSAFDVIGFLCLWILLAAAFWLPFLRWREARLHSLASSMLSFTPGIAFFASFAPFAGALDDLSYEPALPSLVSAGAATVRIVLPMTALAWFLLMGYATATRRLPLRRPRSAWLVSVLGPAVIVAAWPFVRLGF